jgi:hypothetical protein
MEEKKVNNELQKQTDDIVKSLSNAFKGLPHLPENVREVLVKIAPWLALIFGILGVIGGVLAILASPVAMLGGVRSSATVFLTGALTTAASILMLLAYPKLQKRAYAGWVYMFWSEALNVIYAIVSVSFGSVLGILIGLYVLFEIKQHYK